MAQFLGGTLNLGAWAETDLETTFKEFRMIMAGIENSNLTKTEQFATDTNIALGNKVDKVVGKQLSTEDFTSLEKTKLEGVADNANNYTHPIGDGNLHVPATGVNSVGKMLTAGETAGSLQWVDAPSGFAISETQPVKADLWFKVVG